MKTFPRALRAAIALLCAHSAQALACDACGCLSDLDPIYTSDNTIAVRWLSQHSRTDADSSGATTSGRDKGSHILHMDDAPLPTDESRAIVELALRQHVAPNVLLTATFPITQITTTGGEASREAGFGDITLTGQYLLNQVGLVGGEGTIELGGGVTIPTGRVNLHDDDGETLEPHHQIGSGTTDLVAQVGGSVTWGNWSTGVDVTARYALPRNASHQGSSFSASALGVRSLLGELCEKEWLGVKGGLREEEAGNDVVDGETTTKGGHATLFGLFGLSARWGALDIDAMGMAPLARTADDPSHPAESMRVTAGLRMRL